MRSSRKKDLLCHIHLQALELDLIAPAYNFCPFCCHCHHYQQDPCYVWSKYDLAWKQGYENQSILCPCHHLCSVHCPFEYMFQAIFDFLLKIFLYLLVFVIFTIFWSVPRGQSFYIQLTYNSFIIKTIKSEKTKKNENEKTETEVDNQSESSYCLYDYQILSGISRMLGIQMMLTIHCYTCGVSASLKAYTQE